MSEVMIQADGLVKIYKSKQTEVLALQGLDLTVEKGELTALIGNSGSGKSTFLNMIGGLDRPSAGSLLVDGKNLFTMGERELVCYKRDTVGFVWQNNARNLLPYLSALENIMLPMHISGQKKKKEKNVLMHKLSTHKCGCFCIDRNSFELFNTSFKESQTLKNGSFSMGGRPQKGPFRQWNLHRFMKCLTAWKAERMP